jgi:GT2 family glycosyltransferase
MVEKCVSVVLLNWNGWRDTIECLTSLYQTTYDNYDVIVVDNGSEDASVAQILAWTDGQRRGDFSPSNGETRKKPTSVKSYTREAAAILERRGADGHHHATETLTLIRNGRNIGFAEGNNVGIRYAMHVSNADYVLILNNDTVVDKDLITELVKAEESDEKIGAVEPIICDYDRPRKVQFAGGGRVNLYTGKFSEAHGDVAQTRDVDILSGACFLLKREVIERVGGFDKDFFLYCEEADLSIRIRKEGYRIVYVPQARIWHKGAASTARDRRLEVYHRTRSMFFFMRKHATKTQYYSFVVSFILTLPLIAGSIVINRKTPALLKVLVKGIQDGAFQSIDLHSQS